MSRRELVAKLRSPCLADEDFDKGLIVLRVADHDLVNISSHGGLIRHRGVPVWDSGSLPSERVVGGIRRRLLVDVDVSRIDAFPNPSQSISLDNVVFLRNLAVLIDGCIGQTIESKPSQPQLRSGKKQVTYVPLGYLRSRVAFFRKTWHRPYPRSTLACAKMLGPGGGNTKKLRQPCSKSRRLLCRNRNNS